MFYTEKSVLRYYVRFSQIRSHIWSIVYMHALLECTYVIVFYIIDAHVIVAVSY